jgi:hypothetical protein
MVNGDINDQLDTVESRLKSIQRRNKRLTSVTWSLGYLPAYTDAPQRISQSEIDLDKTISKRQRWNKWRKSRSRGFWVLLGAAVTTFLLLVVFLPYFLTRSDPVPLPTPADIIPSSYLVDIKSAQDEPTRLAVYLIKIQG